MYIYIYIIYIYIYIYIGDSLMDAACRSCQEILHRDLAQRSCKLPPKDILCWSSIEILSTGLAQDLHRFHVERYLLEDALYRS